MKEFLFVFRRDLSKEATQLSPEKMQTLMKAWQDWMGSLAAQNKFGGPGKRLGNEGKVLKTNKLVTDGPYVEVKEVIVGYCFVKANNIDEAAELAKDCPNLMMGGSVEVRPIWAEDNDS
jgi:hypothetical protein